MYGTAAQCRIAVGGWWLAPTHEIRHGAAVPYEHEQLRMGDETAGAHPSQLQHGEAEPHLRPVVAASPRHHRRDRDAAQERVNIWLKKIKDAEDRKKELTASIDLINKQIASVEPSGSFFLLNAPMLDFIAPTFKIDQVVLSDLYIDMNYMPVPRVDRCQTCHRAIDRPGFESHKEAARLEKELQAKLDG